MKHSLRALSYPLLCSVVLTQSAAAANLLLNGNFTGITNTVAGNTYTYGQFGNNSGTATGSVLTVNNWDTAGYNFVYTPGVVDQGTTAGGAKAGIAKEAPGQATVNGYGNQYLWGTNNGGVNAWPTTNPFSGNFIGADGAYETGAITQTVTGLTTGQVYALNFYWAAAQQESYTSATTENWKVMLGSDAQTTPTFSLASKGFSGWMNQTMNFTASGTSETLSFLAQGTPTGQPPFVALGGVSLNQVPEPSSWALFGILGGGLTTVGVLRRRRQAHVDADEANA